MIATSSAIPIGTVWTLRAAPVGSWTSVTWGGWPGQELFVAVSSDGHVMTSPDGVSWIPQTNPNQQWSSVSWGGDGPQSGLAPTFYAVATNLAGAPAGGKMMWSPDGVNWTQQDSVDDTANWTAVSGAGGAFVAVGNSSPSTGVVMNANLSPSGVAEWSAPDTPVNTPWTGLAGGGNVFVAVSPGGQVMTSIASAGYNWNQETAPSHPWQAVGWGNPDGNPLFVAIAQDGALITSPDGQTWTQQTSVAAQPWESINWGGPQGQPMFVAVAPTAVMTSPDGITWTPQPLPTGSTGGWSAVVAGGVVGQETLVAVSSNGQVMTSQVTSTPVP